MKGGLRRQAGLSLIELMIASVVALILLAGVGQLFLTSRQMNVADEEMADITDTARYLLHVLSENARQAGVVGCAKLGANNYTSSIAAYDGEYAHPFNIGVQGYQKGVSTLPATLNTLDIASGTDILVIRRASDQGTPLTEPQTDTTFYTQYRSTGTSDCTSGGKPINDICRDDVLIVSDCQKARSFVVSSIATTDIGNDTRVNIDHGNNNNPQTWGGPASTSPLDKFDRRDTSVHKAATTAYYVSAAGDFFAKVNGDPAERLASGIEYLRALYGVDSDDDGSVNKYVNATALSTDPQVADNFTRVISLQLAVLIRSQRPVQNPNEIPATGSHSFDLLGTTVQRDYDGFIHKVFTTTIQLRNGGVL